VLFQRGNDDGYSDDNDTFVVMMVEAIAVLILRQGCDGDSARLRCMCHPKVALSIISIVFCSLSAKQYSF
jgi:hypothetical protein